MSKDKETKKSEYLRDESTPKSKYLRDESTPKSKYLRDESTPKSKYLRDKDEKTSEVSEPGEFRESVLTPKRAKEQYFEEEGITEDTSQVVNGNEHFTSKGTPNDMFKETKVEKEQISFYRNKEASETHKDEKKRATVRMVLSLIVLTAAAILLQFAAFHVPNTPTLLTVEFSTLPELIASIAYGPLFGVAVCIFKNIVHVVFHPSYVISDFANLLLDSSFVFIAGLLYSRSMFYGDKKVIQPEDAHKDYRRKRIFKSAFIGSIISAVPQFLITRFIAYPLFDKYYADQGGSTERILAAYQESYDIITAKLPPFIANLIPHVTNISRAIILYNLPMTFIKLFIVTCITALIYKYISRPLHYRKKKKAK